MASGPVNLGVSPEINCMLTNYVEMCKRIPEFPHEWKRSIFVSYPKADKTVSEMTSSHVNKAIKRIWSLGPIEKPISATKIRKSTSTHVRAIAPESREEIARHMSHEPSTADKYYQLYDQQAKAKPVCQLIARVMEGPSEESNHWPKTIARVMKAPLLNVEKSIHWPKSRKEKNPSPELEKSDEDTDSTIDYFGVEEIVGPPSPLFSNELIDPPEDSDTEITETPEDKIEIASSVEASIRSQYKQYISKLSESTGESLQQHRRRSFTEDEASTLIRLCETILNSGKITKASIMDTLHSTEQDVYYSLDLKISSREKTTGK
ncbi:unnamed protein product [Mytilus coruscus]|uniref:Uncharacterized protein n=1 Tax=Mytilus coruscus TaxID=42192 RepID=A0A6J8C2X1_MYTCO|nr:unnamed protein product [Mytilus coruscus]